MLRSTTGCYATDSVLLDELGVVSRTEPGSEPILGVVRRVPRMDGVRLRTDASTRMATCRAGISMAWTSRWSISDRLKARMSNAAVFVAVVLFFLHFLATFVYLTPINPVKLRLVTSSRVT